MTSTPAAPQELQTIAAALDSFEITHMGGPTYSLVKRTDTGTWVINDDYGIAWFPGQTWDDESSEPTREDYFDVEYDDETGEISNLTEFAAWATQQMTEDGATESDTDRNARAKHEGYAAGVAAYAEHGDLNSNSMIAHYASTAAGVAFSERGSARAIYGTAFINGYNTAQVQA